MSGQSLQPSSRPFAVGLVLGGVVSVQVGAAVATTLFDELGPAGTVFLRIGFAAVVLLAIWRPVARGLSGIARRDVLLFGVVLGGDELELLRGARPDPARDRGDARVRRPARGGDRGLAPGDRPALGRPGGGRDPAPLPRSRRLARRARRRAGPARRSLLGRLHPALGPRRSHLRRRHRPRPGDGGRDAGGPPRRDRRGRRRADRASRCWRSASASRC